MIEPINISVILPTHNRAALLPRAVDSVLAQTYREFELIIVDDASTDNTQAVLEAYRDDPRVRILRCETNLGGSGARNHGIAHARGAYIAFQDSDDFWMPHKLEAQLAVLKAKPEAGLCYCHALYYRAHKDDSHPRDCYLLPSRDFDRLSGDMSGEVLKRNPASTQMILVRRAALERAGGFDQSFRRFQDWDLVIRLAQVTEFAFVHDPLVVVYETPGNISSVQINDAIFRAAILEKYKDLFRKYPQIRSRQNYIAARVWQECGEHGRAIRHLSRALQSAPRPRTLALAGYTIARSALKILPPNRVVGIQK